jgi:hypothetical protein
MLKAQAVPAKEWPTAQAVVSAKDHSKQASTIIPARTYTGRSHVAFARIDKA